MEAYAVVETGGKQYIVRKDASIEVERLEGDVGAKVTLENVLAISDGTALTVGAPTVKGVKVAAVIEQQFRAEKVVNFKKKRRKGFHKKIGHRQNLTRLKVEAIG